MGGSVIFFFSILLTLKQQTGNGMTINEAFGDSVDIKLAVNIYVKIIGICIDDP